MYLLRRRKKLPNGKYRHQVQWRRKKLPNGKYLLIAITKEPGPRGGHTVAQVKSSQLPKKRRKVKVKRRG